MLWRKTKLYKSPSEIEKAISGLLPEVWASSSPTLTFSPSLSVSALTEFVSTIAQKKQPWTKGPHTCDLYTIILSLSKISPEVFGSAWTTKGELLPSPVTTIWAAANKALGSPWVLVHKIVTTTKSILKGSKKKLTSCGLTFNPEYVSRKTSGGHFISGTTQRVPPAKRQELQKQFARKYKTFIDVIVPGNHHGAHKNNSFLENFRLIIVAIMGMEKRLVVLPFPDRPLAANFRPFQGDASMLSGVSKDRLYLDLLWVREGQDVLVKIFVAHDIDPLFFNSLEFASVCNDLDGALSVSRIQSSNITRAGYFLGSRITMNPVHWSDLLNTHPRLLKLDVSVVMEKIQVKSSAVWDPKTNARALHVYYASNQEDQVNKVLISIYNKNRRWMNMEQSLPEGNVFRYFPYNMQHKITLTPRRSAQLLKSKVVQRFTFLEVPVLQIKIPRFPLHEIQRVILGLVHQFLWLNSIVDDNFAML